MNSMLRPCVCVSVIWVLASIDPFSFKWAGLPMVLIKNKLIPFLVWFSAALKMNSEQLQVESCNPTAVNYGYNLLDFFFQLLFCFCGMNNRIREVQREYIWKKFWYSYNPVWMLKYRAKFAKSKLQLSVKMTLNQTL